MVKAVDERSLRPEPSEVGSFDVVSASRARAALPAVRVALDALTTVAALGAALFLRFGLELLAVKEAQALTVQAHLLAGAIWVAVMIGALGWNRLYDEDTLFSGGGEISRVIGAVLQAVAVMSVFVFLTQSFYVSRSWLGMTVVLTAIAVGSERLIIRSVVARAREAGRLQRPAFLVSRGDDEWPEWVREKNHEFAIVKRLDARSFETMAESLSAEDRERLTGTAVILRARDFDHAEFWRIVLLAGGLGWTVYVHSPVRSIARDRLAVREVGGHTMVRVRPPTLTGWRAAQKRSLDVAGSTLLILLLSPLLLSIAAALLMTSGLPILYRQERVGLNGRLFMMLKFRSMTRDAEAESGPVWTTADDARRTKVGAFLRRSSLDELPQLFNVLVGHMSLIGPRPERPHFVDDFSGRFEWYAFRHRIRPGMTGWAQAHGLRGDTGLDQRIEFDNWYIENWSIPLDVKIALRTIVEVVRGRNAR